MVHNLYKASLPGSMMLMGEHSVLRGQPALVGAIDKRIHVTLIPRQDTQIIFKSNLGESQSDITAVPLCEPWAFVGSAVQALKDQISVGFELNIESDFSHKVGFGSSAAVTLGVLACLLNWIDNKKPDNERLFILAKQVIHTVQGLGSGADVAASLYGGIVLYQLEPEFQIKPLNKIIPLSCIYCGYKEKTKQVVEFVNKKVARYPRFYKSIDNLAGELVYQAAEAIESDNLIKLGELMNMAQGLMYTMGVSNQDIEIHLATLRSEQTIYGAKISGSGLGDCVIGLGESQTTLHNQLPVSMTQIGLRYD